MAINLDTRPFPNMPPLEIEDRENYFSQDELAEFGSFICDNLLSTKREFAWLGRVIIRDDGRSGYLGYWDAKIVKSSQDPSVIIGIVAVVVINFYQLNLSFKTHQQRLNEVKEILAHEYGHHWTLSHLLVNGVVKDYWLDRLPTDYYAIRPLSEEQHFPNYQGGSWQRCDKEIIAEDYRCLFADLPDQRDHQMLGLDGLQYPCERVRDYIRNIPSLSL
ncbi:MAG: hypothetical protein QNJ42_05515 [Crocosphaera sp.]|nr:hypothetical protein [Crocosphaera sp.]